MTQLKTCCASRGEKGVAADSTLLLSATLQRSNAGSVKDMVRLNGGSFLMGTDSREGFPADGEGPVRTVSLDPFFIDVFPVTNLAFAEFVNATGYCTEAEKYGWSFVFKGHIAPKDYERLVEAVIVGAEWWCKVSGVDWRHPEGPETNIEGRDNYPVVQVSWNDAAAYAAWTGKRLPYEAEWEYAARGGLEQKLYPWGDELTPGGKHLCNIWQGKFPDHDTAEDGYASVAPVDAFPPNGYGLYSVTGNIWEWCADWFHPTFHRFATQSNPTGPQNGTAKVTKGGSYLCHKSYCNRYRVAARSSNTPDSAATNIGFRCVRDV